MDSEGMIDNKEEEKLQDMKDLLEAFSKKPKKVSDQADYMDDPDLAEAIKASLHQMEAEKKWLIEATPA